MIRLLIYIFLLLGCSLHGQNYVQLDDLDRKSQKKFKQALDCLRKDRSKAIKLLSELTAKYPDFADAHVQLTEAFMRDKKPEDAFEHLNNLSRINYDMSIPYRMTYVDLLEDKNRCGDALRQMEHLINKPGMSSKQKELIEHRQAELSFRKNAYENPIEISPQGLGPNINTDADEYLPAFNADGSKMVFTRKKTISGTYQQNEDLWISNIVNDTFEEAKPIAELNTYNNEGAHSFSQNGKILIFTACGRRDSYGGCDLYISFKKNNKWSTPVNMGPEINSRYWDAQPVLANNNRTIYFSSKRRGGKGGSDIWKIDLLPDNKWGNLTNLGSKINTNKDEASPFMHPDNKTLYFRSNGHVGMGDYDLFLARLVEYKWEAPVNLGYPINTKGSEGALFVDLFGQYAYYASDATTGFKNLDIERFELPEHIKPSVVSYINIAVFDAETGNPIQANLILKSKSAHTYTSDKDGEILEAITPGDYNLSIDKEGYIFHSEYLEIDSVRGSVQPYYFEVQLQKMPENVGEFESTPIVLKNIFFEFGSANLLEKSFIEIEKLRVLLVENPDINIKITGHTDNVGDDSSNLELSVSRAKSVFEALLSMGIDQDRIQFSGEGELNPIDTNESDEGRSNNRRVEFVVFKNG